MNEQILITLFLTNMWTFQDYSVFVNLMSSSYLWTTNSASSTFSELLQPEPGQAGPKYV